ncbi:sulfatase [Myxococcota bacterium]|nr:sulfatase [Myxococcota bacterium]
MLMASALTCTPPPPAKPPNFVVVVVDTLRLDAHRFAGGRESMPHTTALAKRGVSFDNAYSTSSWTLPAMASLWLSQIGSQHRAIAWGSSLQEREPTLVETLSAAGYETAGWTANVLLKEGFGFEQGFDRYESVVDLGNWGKTKLELFPNATATTVNELAQGWLTTRQHEKREAPFFLYLHYMEPHTPYRCETSESCRAGAAVLSERLVDGNWNFGPQETRLIHGLYGTEVKSFDEALGQWVAFLEEAGLTQNTWIVLTADHGELLGEGGHYLHGESLAPAEIRIPLIIAGPGAAPGTVETPVSLIDLAPTLLDLAQIPAPPSFRGRSLVPALDGDPLKPEPVIVELFPRAGISPRHRLVVIVGPETFVMKPNGTLSRIENNAGRARPASRADLEAALGVAANWIDYEDPDPDEQPEISPEMRERLELLGYAR